jgi:hypothetical protein
MTVKRRPSVCPRPNDGLQRFDAAKQPHSGREEGAGTMTSYRIFSVLGSAILFAAMAVNAQEPSADGPGHGHGGMMGPRMELLGFEGMTPGKVVTGVPFNAVAVAESRQTLADGNTITRKVETNLYRDGQGRTRRETTLPAVGPLASTGQSHTFVVIHDPVSSSMFVLHADSKVAERMPPPRNHGNTADMQSKFEAHIQKEIAAGTLKKEDLGTQTFNGIAAQGTRYTKTIPAGQDGNEKPIIITTERWVSPDLQILVKSTHSDPRQGDASYTVTSLQRQEPAASLFTVPADYTVTQGHGSAHGHHKGGQAPTASDASPAN